MKLLQNANVKHYWNASGAFGRELAKTVGLKRGDELVYAWDVWLIYGPEAVGGLQGNAQFPRLDSEVFAREVDQLLNRLPSATSRP